MQAVHLLPAALCMDIFKALDVIARERKLTLKGHPGTKDLHKAQQTAFTPFKV